MALIRFDIEFRSGGEQSPFFGRAQQKHLPEKFLGLESHVVRTVDLIELGTEKPEEAGISSFSSSSSSIGSSKSQKSDPKPALSMDGLAKAIGCMIKPDIKAFYLGNVCDGDLVDSACRTRSNDRFAWYNGRE